MLPGVKRILYASDLREGSRPAFRAAVSLCGHYESHITYLHVIESAGTQAEKIVREMMARDASLRAMHDSCVQEVHDGIFQRVQAFCDTELDDDERLKPEQLDARVTEGEPWREILKAADDIHASVIDYLEVVVYLALVCSGVNVSCFCQRLLPCFHFDVRHKFSWPLTRRH